MSVTHQDIKKNIERGLFSEIEFEISHKCNMACEYCPNGDHQRIEKGDMDISLFEKVMYELREVGFNGRVSYHFYNEPLLSKKFNTFVKLTKKYLPQSISYLFSNGTLLNQKKFDELIELGVDKFHITKHKGVNSSYAFDQVYRSLPEKYSDRVLFQDYTQIELSNRGGILPINASQSMERLPCFIPLRLVVITLEGHVLPCYDDYFQKLSMGNVRENNIIDIWNSSKYQNFRSEIRNKGGRRNFETCSLCSNFKLN
jgi:radical SAM protein with 4Fe4S-binding SPASM domain